MAAKQLVLIDAYSQIFRSFYAIRHLTNANGEPVNAAFVFTKLLLKLDEMFPSEAGAMLFDCGKVQFRSQIHPEYKANRPPMPDDLKSQMPLIRRIAGAFGWEMMQHENWEADDLIGALCLKFPEYEVQIVSSDKDLSQLVDDRVKMLVPSNAGFESRGTAEVVAKFGVSPDLIVDYLALLGDASDNIPGVPGIGPKSAADLLNTCGAAADWLDEPEKLVDCKYCKKLLPHLEVLRRNRELIRLRTELPDTWKKMEVPVRRNPDWAEIAAICRENQFNSILKELPESLPEVETATAAGNDADDLFAFAAQNVAVTADCNDNAVSVEQPELF